MGTPCVRLSLQLSCLFLQMYACALKSGVACRFADLMDLRKDRSRLDHYLRPAATAPPAPVDELKPVTLSGGAATPAQLPHSRSAPLPRRPADAGAVKAGTPCEDASGCRDARGDCACCGSCELPPEQAAPVQSESPAPGVAQPEGKGCGTGDPHAHPESRVTWPGDPSGSPDSWASDGGAADGPGCAGHSARAGWADGAHEPRSSSGAGCGAARPEPGTGAASDAAGDGGAQKPADRGAESGHAAAAHRGGGRGSAGPQPCSARTAGRSSAERGAAGGQAHTAAAHEGHGMGAGEVRLHGSGAGGSGSSRGFATTPKHEPVQAHAAAAHCPGAASAQAGAAAAPGADALDLADVDLGEQQRLWAAVEARQALRAGARRCAAAQPARGGARRASGPGAGPGAGRALGPGAGPAGSPVQPCKRAEAPAGAPCGGGKRRQLTLGSFFGAGAQR